MDPLNAQAFDALAGTVRSLLPGAPEVRINPVRVSPSGLAGFVGLSHEPEGQIVGRLVDARTVVTVEEATASELDDAVAGVTQALVGADRGDLRAAGVLRLALDEVGSPSGDGPLRRDVTFAVAYEFVKGPDDGEGIIEEIPIDTDLDGSGRTLVDSAFMEGSLEWFEVVDDPAATNFAPSDWAYDPDEERIVQRAGTYGGAPASTNANKPGTYLVLRGTPTRPPLADLILKAQLRSDHEQGIGLVFRYVDVDNFCFLLLNQARNFRMLAKKAGGAFESLQEPALDETAGFEIGRSYRAKVVVRGDLVQAYLDEQLVLEGRDGDLPGPGRAGFMTYRNPDASFHRLVLKEI
jgi:hypothetical protein